MEGFLAMATLPKIPIWNRELHINGMDISSYRADEISICEVSVCTLIRV
jgi:hypothetical protein